MIPNVLEVFIIAILIMSGKNGIVCKKGHRHNFIILFLRHVL